MKVTIDSSEPLQDALRVVGALYDVELSVSSGVSDGVHEQTVAVPTTDRPSSKKASSKKPSSKKASRSRPGSRPRVTARTKTAAAKSSTPVSTLELRSWARQNGFTVSERGRVASKVVAAYRAAHSS